MKRIPLLLGLAICALTASAATITVHNTGVDALDTLVSPGGSTAFWQLTAQPSGAGYTLGSNPFRYYNGAYSPDLTQAAWVSPGANGLAGTSGYYTYSLTIDLTGLDPSTALITGRFSTDNDGSIGLNGSALFSTGFANFGSLHPFSISSGFLPGLNTIDVRVNNGGDPTAFIVVFDSATANPAGAVPDSGSALALTVLGLASILLVARSRA